MRRRRHGRCGGKSHRPCVRCEAPQALWSNLGARLRGNCAIIDPMFDPAAEPRWMRRCTALAQRLGFLPSLAGLSVLLVLGVLGLTQAAVLALGQGPKPLALLLAGAMALVPSPFLAAWLLRPPRPGLAPGFFVGGHCDVAHRLCIFTA